MAAQTRSISLLSVSAPTGRNDALSAVHTRHIIKRLAEHRLNDGVETALCGADSPDLLYAAAHRHAAAAEYAFVGIAHDGRGDGAERPVMVVPLIRDVADTQLITQRLQLTVAVSHAGETAFVVVGEYQLKIHAPRFLYCPRFGRYDHAFFGRKHAGSLQAAAAFDHLDEAHTACADGINAFQIAQCGYSYAGRPRRLQNGGVLWYLHFDSIYR